MSEDNRRLQFSMKSWFSAGGRVGYLRPSALLGMVPLGVRRFCSEGRRSGPAMSKDRVEEPGPRGLRRCRNDQGGFCGHRLLKVTRIAARTLTSARVITPGFLEGGR